MNNHKSSARPASGRAFFKNRGLAPTPLTGQLVFWTLLVHGVVLDLWTKATVFKWLGEQQRTTVPVIDGFLQLVLAQNPGAAFGIALGQRYLLIAVSCFALIVIFTILFFAAIRQKLLLVALALFAAGVCGNLYDRMFNNGLVRDFIDVVYWPGKHWPAFNVADSMLCVAVGLWIISSLVTEKSCQKRGQQHK